jgi:hypothetical protein
MFNNQKRKFLFRCEDCEMVLSVDFEEEDDLQRVDEDKMELECPCGGLCKILRD